MSTTIGPTDAARVTAIPSDGNGIPDSPVTLLRRWVTAAPQALAVVSDSVTLNRRQWWDGAGRVASHLRLRGTDPNTCVGLYLEASVELVQAAWGVLGSGAGYLPLSGCAWRPATPSVNCTSPGRSWRAATCTTTS